jgi:hypothetical protein
MLINAEGHCTGRPHWDLNYTEGGKIIWFCVYANRQEFSTYAKADF